MVDRNDVLACYKFLLDRSPENDAVVDAKCEARDIADVVVSMVTGEEFLENHKHAIAIYFHAQSRIRTTHSD